MITMKRRKATRGGGYTAVHGVYRHPPLSEDEQEEKGNDESSPPPSSPSSFLLVVLLVIAAASLLSAYAYYCMDLDLSPEVHLQALIHIDVEEEPIMEQGPTGTGSVMQRLLPLGYYYQQQKHATLSASFVIFYHIFLPPSRRGILNAQRIVAEQLGQIGSSLRSAMIVNATASTTTSETVLLFYTTVGCKNALSQSTLQQLCRENHLRCISLGHYASGFEEVTLTPLHQFCTSQQEQQQQQQHDVDDNVRVVYIHNKGSFHSQRGENDRWRRHMTRAVTSAGCLNPPLAQQPQQPDMSKNRSGSSSSCTVCGLLFAPLWTMMFPGNMWTASCFYVRKLHPPTVFREKMNALVHNKLARLRHEGIVTTKLFPVDLSGGYLGTDRYAAEHWIASHPDVVACDVSPTANLEYWWQHDLTTIENGNNEKQHQQQHEQLLEQQWSMAPRHSIAAPWFRLNQSLVAELMQDEAYKKEFFFLSGFVFKWMELYGTIPPVSSWIWTWFPNNNSNNNNNNNGDDNDNYQQWKETVDRSYGINNNNNKAVATNANILFETTER